MQTPFGQQNPELFPDSWKLSGNIFFGLFLTDLDENMTSAGYERHQNENSATRLSDKLTIIQFRPRGDSHARLKNSLSLDNFSRVSRKLRTQKQTSDLRPQTPNTQTSRFFNWKKKKFFENDLHSKLVSILGFH